MDIKRYDRMTVYRYKEFKRHSIYAFKRFTNLNVMKRLALSDRYSLFLTQNRVIEKYNITKITIIKNRYKNVLKPWD